MTDRFTYEPYTDNEIIIFNENKHVCDVDNETDAKDLCKLLNNLNDERDYWRKRALLLENKYGDHDNDRE